MTPHFISVFIKKLLFFRVWSCIVGNKWTCSLIKK